MSAIFELQHQGFDISAVPATKVAIVALDFDFPKIQRS